MDDKDWHIENGMAKICFNDAGEFVSTLETLMDYSTEIYEGWIFRGHAVADWKLLPQSFREEGAWKPWPFPKSDPLDQLRTEADFLIDFAELCDEVGIEVPMPQSFYISTTEWGKEIKSRFSDQNRCEDSRYSWESNYYEALAYAQHSGMPTRLLDFTKNPLYAAFFAIRDWLKNPKANKPDRLCVWGVNLALLKDKNLFTYRKINRCRYKPGEPWQRFKSIRMPWARNVFLKAQEGIFVIDSGAEFIRAMDNLTYQPIEEVVINSKHVFKEPVLKKVELNASEETARKALKSLRQGNITEAKLKPTLQYVVSTLRSFDEIGIELYSKGDN